MMRHLHGKRVTIMGLGRFGGGIGAARYAAERGAHVTVTDTQDAEALAEPMRELDGLPLTFHLGDHDETDFSSADCIIINPAVDRRGNRFLQAAHEAGVELTSEIELLIEHLNRQRVIGVTGSAGKSTTVAMIGHILKKSVGADQVHVGGNIGGSLLTQLDRIERHHWVVLELSSFMLEPMTGWSPGVAVITNISDNHLDRHGTMADYIAAKQNIVASQQPGDTAVLGPSVRRWPTPPAVHRIELKTSWDIPLQLPGEHNRLNASLAITVGEAIALGHGGQLVERLKDFTGLPHRLQRVHEEGGVRFFDDSKSTTPDAARLAIDAFAVGSVHAILGGYDKQTDLSPLARHAAGRCRAIYTIGQTGPAIADVASGAAGACAVHRCGDLETAVRRAVTNARDGDVVLLSPACASWDQFPNYQARGRLFGQLILRYNDTKETDA